MAASPSDPLFLLLDALIAFRLEFANGTEDEKRMTATYGRAKLLAVRTTLDKAIHGVKHVVDSTYRPTPSKSRSRPQGPKPARIRPESGNSRRIAETLNRRLAQDE